MGWLIVIGVIIYLLYLLVVYVIIPLLTGVVLPVLGIVLLAMLVAGIIAGTFSGIKNYWLSINENINSKVLKGTMFFMTSIFILAFLGAGTFLSYQHLYDVLPPAFNPFASPAAVQTGSAIPSEIWTERIVNSDGLNVRSGPSVNYPIAFVLHRNTVVMVSNMDGSGNWVKISHNNREGFVNQTFLRTP